MLIGEVAAATGVSTKTLRFYEREALLPEPDRLPNGYRDYDLGRPPGSPGYQRLVAGGSWLGPVRRRLPPPSGMAIHRKPASRWA